MKKILCLLLLIWSTSSSYAQITINEVQKRFTEQYGLIKKARDAKDYQKAEQINKDMITAFQSYPDSIKKIANSMNGLLYYDLTCYQSLQNKKKKAVESFARAVENGWTNYSHANKDSDLDNIRKDKRFILLMKKIRAEGDYQYILKQGGVYTNKVDSTLPIFTYLPPNDRNLVRIREYFNLDSIAGSGNEISKIKNLLHWAHNVVRHDGTSMSPESKNAIDLVKICKKENRGINCRMMAQLLNECYLAMGFKSRYVTCMPKKYIDDCHVINVVYSNTLDKWIWMDPTFNAYVTDENGTLLSIAEVRERLISEAPLLLNEDANWNNKEKQTKEHYLGYYMTKNLYYLECVLNTGYNTETPMEHKPSNTFIKLYPASAIQAGNAEKEKTDNAQYFWQSPQQ